MNVFGNKLPKKKGRYIKEDTTFSAQLVFSSNELKFYAEAISIFKYIPLRYTCVLSLEQQTTKY